MPSGLRRVFSIRETYKATMGKAQEDRVNVEKAMFKAHTFHFLLSASKASLFPFLTIYFRLLGISATQVGLVFAAQAFIRLWCAPIWTACAKACRKKKFVLMFSTFILLASSLCLSLAPPSDMEHSPLFCKGALRPAKPEHSDGQLQSGHIGNITSSTVLPVGKESPVEAVSKNTEVGKEVNSGRKNEKEHSTSTSAVPPKSTTTTATTTTTTTTATTTTTTTRAPSSKTTTTSPTTTTTHASRRHNKHKQTKDEEAEQLADKLLEKGVNAEDLKELDSDGLEKLLAAVLNDGSENGLSGDDSYDDRKYKNDYNDDESKHGKSRHKRHGKSDDDEVEREPGSTWGGLSERFGQEVQEHKTFAFIMALIMAGELFAAPLDKLADDCWFEYLDVLDVVERYGGHRVWQLVGYVLLPAFAGTLVEKTHCILMNNVPHFMIHFFLFAAFAALAFLAAFGYPVSQNKRTPKQSRVGKGMRILCCDIHSLTISFTILLLGMIYACIQNFLLWKVQDVGGNEIVVGTAVAVAAFSALFMYIVSNAIIKRITHVGAITLALITLAGRLVFYSFLWTPWLVLAGEALHGFSYTLLWRAVEMYPDFRINPFIMDRSAFTMINVVYHGLGIGIGSALSGILYDLFGFSLLFQGAAVAITAWCAMFLLLQKCMKRKMKVRYAKLLQDDRGMDESSDDEEDWLEVAMKSSR